MKNQYTQGPWRIVEEPHQKMISNWGIQIGSHKISFFPYVYQYADIEKTCGGYVTDHEMHANARLIAAAPELLEALLEYKRLYEEVQPSGGWQGVYETGNSAIAKATGKVTK